MRIVHHKSKNASSLRATKVLEICAQPDWGKASPEPIISNIEMWSVKRSEDNILTKCTNHLDKKPWRRCSQEFSCLKCEQTYKWWESVVSSMRALVESYLKYFLMKESNNLWAVFDLYSKEKNASEVYWESISLPWTAVMSVRLVEVDRRNRV